MIESNDYANRPVRSLQTMLRILFQQDEAAPVIIPDGIFGPQTEAAVSYFQKKNKLPVTGVADFATWDKLVPLYEAALLEQGPSEPLILVLNPNQVIRAGEWNYHLFLIQAILAVLAEIHKDFPRVPVSGVLDPETAKSISCFQKVTGLPVTGEIDKSTWQQLARHYPNAVGDGTGWASQKPE